MSFTENFDNKQITRFLRLASFSGLWGMYFFKIAHDKKIGVRLDELKDYYSPTDLQHMGGFLGACYSIGLINYTQNKGICNVLGYDSELDKHIYSFILERAKKLDVESKSENSRVEAIDKLRAEYGIK